MWITAGIPITDIVGHYPIAATERFTTSEETRGAMAVDMRAAVDTTPAGNVLCPDIVEADIARACY